MPTFDPLGDWIRAYSQYASVGVAGPAVLAVPLTSAAVGQFTIQGFSRALMEMWTAAVWVGPGVTAVTSVVPPFEPLLIALTPTLNVSYDPELAPTLIAKALHTYTLSVVVTVTPATGIPFLTTVA
jgi:hypothetical protein